MKKIFLLILAGTVSFLHAQQHTKSNLNFKMLSTVDGLSSNYIRKVVQDEFGFVWVATQDGLNKFDGDKFESFKKGNAINSLLFTDIFDLLPDSAQHRVWIVQPYGGISYISTIDNHITHEINLTHTSSPLDKWILCIQQYKNDLWIGTNNGIAAYNLNTKKFYTIQAPVNKGDQFIHRVKKIYIDNNNHVWSFYENGDITVHDAVTKSVLYTLQSLFEPGKSGKVQINYVDYLSSDHSFVISAGNSLYSLEEKKGSPGTLKKLIQESNAILCSKEISPGKIMVAGINHLFIINTKGEKTELINGAGYFDGPEKNIITGIFADRENNIWISTQMGLFATTLQSSPFIAFSIDGNIRMDHVYSLNYIDDSTVVAASDKGYFLTNINTHHIRHLNPQYSYDFFYALDNHTIIYSRREGTFIATAIDKIDVNPKSAGMVIPELGSINKHRLNDAASFGDTLIVFSTEDQVGLFLWNKKTKKVEQVSADTPPLKLANNIINRIYKDHLSRLWILTDETIMLLDVTKKQIQRLNVTAGLNVFFDIIESQNNYWISSYGNGVICLDSSLKVTDIINKDKGLCDNSIYKLLPEGSNSSYCWVTSNNGLSRIDLRSKKIFNFKREDGIHNNSFEEFSGACRNGKIFAGGIGGFTQIIAANSDTLSHKANIRFTGYELKGSNYLLKQTSVNISRLDVPAGILQVNIFFSLLNFLTLANNSYDYRIKELSPEWINLGNQSYLSFIGLKHGVYHLELRGHNDVSGESKVVLLTLTVKPYWYQHWLFHLFLISLGALIVYLAYKNKLKNLKEKNAIRKQIAADLHDDIGSTLNSVKIFISLAIQKFGENVNLTQASEALRLASQGLRDMIWVLDNPDDTLGDLTDRLNRFMGPAAAASNINLTFSIKDELRNVSISKVLKKNLLLIAKEAINNSIKYSAATRMEITITGTKNKIQISIADNGKGFNALNITRGNGLNNMEFRAKQIGFTFHITTSSNGTEIIIKQ